VTYENRLAYAITVKAKVVAQLGVYHANLSHLHFIYNRKRSSKRDLPALDFMAVRLNAAKHHVFG
jgi:hypothetical protein